MSQRPSASIATSRPAPPHSYQYQEYTKDNQVHRYEHARTYSQPQSYLPSPPSTKPVYNPQQPRQQLQQPVTSRHRQPSLPHEQQARPRVALHASPFVSSKPSARAHHKELKLDCLRTSLSATHIIARDTKETLYSIVVDAKACSPTTIGIHRGSVDDALTPLSRGASPFAAFKGQSIYMQDGPKAESTLKVKKREFLYSSGYFGQSNKFRYNGVEYKLNKSRTSNIIDLIVASDSTKTPLCRFTSEDNSGDRSSGIDILPRAMSSGKTIAPHSLLHNGRPTNLLDMALVAEKLYRANTRRKSSDSTGEDDYSSDIDA